MGQPFMLQFDGCGDTGENVNQPACVRHMAFQVRMQPAGTPENAIWNGFNDPPDEKGLTSL